MHACTERPKVPKKGTPHTRDLWRLEFLFATACFVVTSRDNAHIILLRPQFSRIASLMLPKHGLCITGLQRSFPEFASNVRMSLETLYTDLNAVTFFGVRPANDTWHAVHATFPALANESTQSSCGVSPPPWFSAYARDWSTKRQFAKSFVMMMCDMAACMKLIEHHEAVARGGLPFETLARLRLDLAWEVPMRMPTHGFHRNAVHTPRMNTKAGINDKWAVGLRAPMSIYMYRVHAIAAANRLLSKNRSAPSPSLFWTHGDNSKGVSLIDYKCQSINPTAGSSFRCDANFDRHTTWQGWNASKRHGHSNATARPITAPQTQNGTHIGHEQKRFTMTSESFLQWALWRRNVSVMYEPSWMFCKFKDATNGTARICVPRMRKKQPCQALSCPGSGVDCGCLNNTCRFYDPRTKKNVTHWYCQNVGGQQLDLAGNLY